jgi:flavocytochrome c
MNEKYLVLETEIDKWDERLEVVVIGSGFAGLTAAIEAKNNGASVVVLEKMKAPGGNSTISDGGIAAPETALQKKYGICDSKELMCEDMLKAGQYTNYQELVKVLVDNARDAFEWSQDYLGVEYLDRIDIFGGHSVARCYTAKNISGKTIIDKQMEKIDELKIQVKFSAYVKGLILDSQGQMSGVVVREDYDYKDSSKGVDRYIKAEKGVVLATGGFGADVNFRMTQDPRLTEEINTTNKPFTTAEVMKQVIDIGAMPVQLSNIQLGPWGSPDEKGYGVGPMFSEYIVFQYGVIVDPATGRRVVNELADRKTISDELLKLGHPCIGIADAKAVKDSGWNIDKGIQRKVISVFDTIEELADFYNIKRDKIKETLARFNKSFETLVDKEFGKPLIDGAAPMTNPPYYGIRLWPKVHFTMGGIQINKEAQVMNRDGQVMKGLYAAGEITGGVHGASRLGSCSITDCLVFGRIAGRNVAQDGKKQL